MYIRRMQTLLPPNNNLGTAADLESVPLLAHLDALGGVARHAVVDMRQLQLIQHLVQVQESFMGTDDFYKHR